MLTVASRSVTTEQEDPDRRSLPEGVRCHDVRMRLSVYRLTRLRFVRGSLFADGDGLRRLRMKWRATARRAERVRRMT